MPNIVTDVGENFNWKAYKVGANEFTITCTSSGSAFNLTPYTFTCRIRKIGTTTDLLLLTQGSGITNGGASGVITIALTEAQANTTLPGTDYFYELTYVVNSVKRRMIQGILTLSTETNPASASTSLSATINLSGTNVSATITLGVSSSSIASALGAQSANVAYMGPASGGAANPAFRALVAGDIPSLSAYELVANKSNSVTNSGTSTNYPTTQAIVKSLTNYLFNIANYGAALDAKLLHDGAMTSGTAILTSATGLFTSADVGKQITVSGAGAASANLVTTILSYQSTTQVTLNTNALTTVSSKKIVWGTDDRAAWIAAVAAAGAVGGEILHPGGSSYITDSITIEKSLTIKGIINVGGTYDNVGAAAYYGPEQVTARIFVAPNKDGFVVQQKVSDSSKPNVSFEKMYFDSAGSFTGSTTGSFIELKNMNQSSIIRDCSFKGGYRQVKITSGFYFHIMNCKFTNPFYNCLYISNNIRPDTADSVVSGNTFVAGYDTGAAPKIAIHWYNGGGVRIVHNKFDTQGVTAPYDMNFAFNYCIYGENPLEATSVLIIANNSLENYKTTGIYFSFTNAFFSLVITGNQFAASTIAPAIDIAGGKYINIDNNAIVSAGFSIPIKLINSDVVNIGVNTVAGYTGPGVDLTGCTNILYAYDPVYKTVGIGTAPDTSFVMKLHASSATSSTTHLKFVNTNTGTAFLDGFQIGIDVDGTAYLVQRENLPVRFYTNNTDRAGILAGGGFEFKNVIIIDSDISPAQITVNQDNYAPTNIGIASTLRISTDASRDITGISGGASMVDGRELTIINVGAANIVLKNDVTSTAANRFLLGADVTVTPNQAVRLIYDGTSARWRKLF